ncbi:MAG: cupin domain-containing protein [Hyphomicrobiales bacterium]
MEHATLDFDWSIAPLTRKAFFNESFEKKHVVVHRNDPAYYCQLVSVDDIDRVVTTMGLSTPEVNVVQANASITPEDFAYESGFIDAVRVNQLFADGATIILSGLQERLPTLARFCRALENVFSSRIQTNIYLTPAHSQGFPSHYDSHDVLVLQVEGTKEWRIYDHPVELPLLTQGFNREEMPVGEETDRFVLEPGDMCYVPRGLTHDAVATDQTSLHITTGLMTRTWADLVTEAVVAVAHRDPAFRASLPAGHARGDFDMAGMETAFADLLQRLQDQANLPELVDHIRTEFIRNRVPRVPGQMRQLARLAELTIDSEVGAQPQLIFQVEDRTDADGNPMVQVGCQGAEIRLPAHTKSALDVCLTNQRFKVRDLPGDLDEDGKLVLVKRLIREGLMVSHA